MSHVEIFLLDTQMLKLPPRACHFGGCRQFILLKLHFIYIMFILCFSVLELVHK